MKATRKEIVEHRIYLVKEMDKFVKNRIGDERIIDCWLMCGVPDGADEIDYREIAEEDELWFDVVREFGKCCNLAGILKQDKGEKSPLFFCAILPIDIVAEMW